MSTSDLLGSGPASESTEPPRTTAGLLKTAGLGALLAFAAWLLIPVQVFLFSDYDEDDPAAFYRTAAEYDDKLWQGPVDLVAFGGIGIGIAVLVLAVGRIALLRESDGLGVDIARFFGLLAATSYVLIGTVGVGWAFAGEGVGDITDDESVQRVVDMIGEPLVSSFLTVGAVGLCGWVVWLAVAGRRAGIVGVPLAAVGFGFVALALVPVALFSIPMGSATLQPLLCLVLGIAFLIKARKA